MIQKWNPELHKYEPYDPPPGYITKYENDMDRLINCASCGKQITFGEGYSSLHIHDYFGFGYSVCENCHESELQEERRKHDDGKAERP